MLKTILKVSTLLLLGVASILSLLHLFGFDNRLPFSTQVVGIIGCAGLISAFLFISQPFIKHTLLVFILFFSFGLFTGPFLEPPSDPLHHLERIQETHNIQTTNIEKTNRGLWHYSILNVLVHLEGEEAKVPQNHLLRIQIAHALVFASLLVVIFITCKTGGLRSRWAFWGTLTAMLFMGTNRFSYFSYYSFAPSSSSLLIFWLWTAYFFLRRGKAHLLGGILCGLAIFPILLTNHLQEAVFLAYTMLIWVLFTVFKAIFQKSLSTNHDGSGTSTLPTRLCIVVFIFAIFFILPQLDFFIEWGANLYKDNYNLPQGVNSLWENNQKLLITLGELHIGGTLVSHRMQDTFAGMGGCMMVMSLLYFSPLLFRTHREQKVKIFILAILPLIIIFTPLLHFFWISNVAMTVYYRISYISMFWLFWAALFQGLEGCFYLGTQKGSRWLRGAVKR